MNNNLALYYEPKSCLRLVNSTVSYPGRSPYGGQRAILILNCGHSIDVKFHTTYKNGKILTRRHCPQCFIEGGRTINYDL